MAKKKKKKSVSSQHEKQRSVSAKALTGDLAAELRVLESMPDVDIDTRDVPEKLNWDNAEIGKFYRPMKEQISMKVDADVLHWFKSKGKKYTTLMNQALRFYIESHEGKV